MLNIFQYLLNQLKNEWYYGHKEIPALPCHLALLKHIFPLNDPNKQLHCPHLKQLLFFQCFAPSIHNPTNGQTPHFQECCSLPKTLLFAIVDDTYPEEYKLV